MKRLLGLLCCGLVGFTTPTDISRCNLAREDAQQFRKHLGTGKLAQIEDQQSKAITSFKKAYQLCDSATLLRLIAQSYRKQGNLKLAKQYDLAHDSEQAKFDLQALPLLPILTEKPQQKVKKRNKAQAYFAVDPTTPELIPILRLKGNKAPAPKSKQKQPDKTSTLVITTSPDGAQVFLNAETTKPIGITPTKRMRLVVGQHHQLIIKKKGHKTIKRGIKLKQDTNTKLHLYLETQTASEKK